VQLTSGADGENSPRWSPDGKTIAFTAKRDDNEFAQIYLMPIDGGEARPLTTHATAVSDIAWTPDGAALYFKAPEAKNAEDKARDRVKDDVYAYDENYKQTHLWRVTVASESRGAHHRRDFSVTDYTCPRTAARSRISARRRRSSDRATRAKSGPRTPAHERRPADEERRPRIQRASRRTTRRSCSFPDPTRRFETYTTAAVLVPASGGTGACSSRDEPYDVDVRRGERRQVDLLVANLGVTRSSSLSGRRRQAAAAEPTANTTSAAWSRSGDRFALTISIRRAPASWRWRGDAAQSRSRTSSSTSRATSSSASGSHLWKGADATTVEGFHHRRLPAAEVSARVMTHGGPQAADKYASDRCRTSSRVLGAKVRDAPAELSRQTVTGRISA